MAPPNRRTKTVRYTQPEGSLMQATRRLLREDTLTRVSMNAQVPLDWLKRFSAGRVTDPSVNRVQHLYEFLSGRNLDL